MHATDLPLTDARTLSRDVLRAVRRGALGFFAAAVVGWMGCRSGAPAIEATHWRVPLDQAAVADLELLPGVGPTLARRVGEVCSEPGPMRAVDLMRVPRLGPTGRRRMAPWVVFGTPSVAHSAARGDVGEDSLSGAGGAADDPEITRVVSR